MTAAATAISRRSWGTVRRCATSYSRWRLVAPTEATVLIYGETGTGKELIARAIHNLSARRGHAFVTLNCAAIPTGLLESELFGHEKGAFTGAVTQRIGRFELAHRGTLFLDEIGELPLEVQPKLLRVLQEREFERLGSARTLRTDARLIAATNRDLAAMVEAQQLPRRPLLSAYTSFPCMCPPLRERPDDIPLLVRYFAQQFARRMHKTIETIPASTMQALHPVPLAGQHSRAAKCHRAGGDPVARAGLAGAPHRPDCRGPRSTTPGSTSPAIQPGARPCRARWRRPSGGTSCAHWRNPSGWWPGRTARPSRLGMPRSTLQRRIQQLGIARRVQ